MLGVRNVIVAALLALVVGFSAGYYTKSRFVLADQIDAASEARHQTAIDVQTSLETSLAVEEKVAASTNHVETIRKKVAQRLNSQESNRANGIKPVSSDRPICDWRLDVGTVQLLNSARSGSTADAAGLGNAEGQAPSAVTATDFIDNDLQVVEQYHDLAARHDALVDYVEALIEKQAE